MSASEGQKMWGGRFERAPDASFYEFERSWHFDRRLLPQELALDRAWARAIAAAGVLTDQEATNLVRALDEIEKRAASDVRMARQLQSRGRPPLRGNGADRKARPAGRQAAHRPQPQRNGGH